MSGFFPLDWYLAGKARMFKNEMEKMFGENFGFWNEPSINDVTVNDVKAYIVKGQWFFDERTKALIL